MKWISVKDKTPQNNKEVLVWVRGYYEIGWIDKEGWYGEFSGYCFDGDVTHRMPLPAPPKEDTP